MAQAIRDSGKRINFYVVDSWNNTDLCPENGPPDTGAYAKPNTKEVFLDNMHKCGVRDLITVVEGDSTEVGLRFENESVDFAFIDGDHREEKVHADLQSWWPKIKPGGLLAGHDFDETYVNRAVTRFAEDKGIALYGDGGWAHGLKCFGLPKPSLEEHNIFLAIPHYDGTVLATSIIMACTRQYTGKGFVAIKEHGASALCSNFNFLWCAALNMPGITHFAMLHADIIPMEWWLDVLMREMEKEKAQLVSTIVPIKDNAGVTSTGIVYDQHHWTPKRRFTMSELMSMPSTFDAEGCGYPGGKLVLNTGCWLADLRDPRWKTKEPDGKLVAHFEMRDMIYENNGKFENHFEPEDFFFSRKVQELGMRAVATRKPAVTHIGNYGFQNSGIWGEWKKDERTRPLWDEQLQAAIGK